MTESLTDNAAVVSTPHLEPSMPRIAFRRHLPHVLGLALGLALVAGIAPTRLDAATPFKMDLYFGSGYERQIDGRTCVAASSAMMLNLIAGRDLRLSQMSILRYAQPRDALNDAKQRGSDPLGWSRAMTYFDYRTGSSFTYQWEAYGSEGCSGTSGPERQLVKYDFLAQFADHLQALKAAGRELIICGDYNIAHKKIDLKNWRGNQKNSGFFTRRTGLDGQLFGDWDLLMRFVS